MLSRGASNRLFATITKTLEGTLKHRAKNKIIISLQLNRQKTLVAEFGGVWLLGVIFYQIQNHIVSSNITQCCVDVKTMARQYTCQYICISTSNIQCILQFLYMCFSNSERQAGFRALMLTNSRLNMSFTLQVERQSSLKLNMQDIHTYTIKTVLCQCQQQLAISSQSNFTHCRFSHKFRHKSSFPTFIYQ